MRVYQSSDMGSSRSPLSEKGDRAKSRFQIAVESKFEESDGPGQNSKS